MDQHFDEAYIKIAVQTVLHRRRDQIDKLLTENQSEVLENLAREITEHALAFQKITEEKIGQLDTLEE